MVSTSLQYPYQEHGRTTGENFKDYPRETRMKLCEFFHGTNPKQFIFTSNATEALNLLIHGYVLQKKETFHVITSNLEHNSVLRPLQTLQKNNAITLNIASCNDDGYITLNEIKPLIQNNTALVVLSHGSNVLGTIQDIQEIGRYLHENDIIFFVDAAQTVGHIPIDIQKIHVDGFAFTGHKSLFGYPGIGGMFINDHSIVDSYLQGGTGVYSQYPYHPEELPLKYEFGTHNYPGIVSLYAGIEYIEQIGISSIQKKTDELTKYILKNIQKIESIIIHTPKPDLPIISFSIDGISPDDTGFLLQEQFGIITRTGLHCAPLIHQKIDNGKGCIRVSPSYFTSYQDCDQLIIALNKITSSIIVNEISKER